MNNKKRIKRRVLVTLIMIIVLTGFFFLITNTITKSTGYSISDLNENDFENCLNEQDITLYINSENADKSLDKIELESYLKYFKIMNCIRDNKLCIQKGVNSFPSWIINDKLIKEDIDLSKLKEFSGCGMATIK